MNIKRKKGKRKVSAIVCAYNEGPRISNVLCSLKKSKYISEILVIDDGSTDDTIEQIKKFKKIRNFRNKKNKGKGYSMDIGVKNAKYDLIFFCDADLNRFNEKIADEIIKPVIENKYGISICLRKRPSYDFMLKYGDLMLPFIISGERIINKSLWDFIPKYYKSRYKVETGINYFALKKKLKIKYKQFDYMITTKEDKYNLLNALKQRASLDKHLVLAHARFILWDFWFS